MKTFFLSAVFAVGLSLVGNQGFAQNSNNSFSTPSPNTSISKSSNKALLGVFTTKANKGAVIKKVMDESSAGKAGLKEGDIITKLGNRDITSPLDLREAVSSYQPGDEVTVNYLRDGKKETVQLKLGKAPGNEAITYNMDSLRNLIQRFNNGNNFGMRRLPYGYFNHENMRPALGLKIEDTQEGTGVVVLEVKPESPAEKAGVKAGDIITEIDNKKIDNVNDAKSHLQQSGNKNEYRIRAKRGSMNKEFDIHIPKTLKSVNI